MKKRIIRKSHTHLASLTSPFVSISHSFCSAYLVHVCGLVGAVNEV